MPQTNIAGVNNRYAKVTHIAHSNDRLVVSPNVFAEGDRVLIIQLNGVPDSMNTADYSKMASLNNEGYYEFSIVKSAIGDTVILSWPLCRSFRTEDSVRLVSVPV